MPFKAGFRAGNVGSRLKTRPKTIFFSIVQRGSNLMEVTRVSFKSNSIYILINNIDSFINN